MMRDNEVEINRHVSPLVHSFTVWIMSRIDFKEVYRMHSSGYTSRTCVHGLYIEPDGGSGIREFPIESRYSSQREPSSQGTRLTV